MAHFAEIDPSTKRVLRVVVVSNSINTDDGPLGDNDMHPGGENWCGKNIKFGAIWKQTSYNHKFRKQFAGQGMFYDEAKDAFIKLQPSFKDELKPFAFTFLIKSNELVVY